MGSLLRAGTCAVLAAALAIACTRTPPRDEHELTGQVLSIDESRREIVIRHGDIKGFMPGMTMPFKVKDEQLLRVAPAGAIVNATLVLQDGDAWLSRVVDTGRREPLPPDAGRTPRVMDPPLEPGAQVPTPTFTDQQGRELPLASLAGQPYALTFVYTRCPLPTFCPALDQRFARVQEAIQRDPALRGARLVSVSIDPEFDQPAVLAAHARALGADPRIWSFVTGETTVVDAFGERFGLNVTRGGTPEDLIHSLRTIVVDGRGRLVRTWRGADWEPAEVVSALRQAAG